MNYAPQQTMEQQQMKKVLTNEQVREIRERHEHEIHSYERLAKIYGVGASTIRDVVKYYTYAGA